MDCLLWPNKKNIAFIKIQQAEIHKTYILILLEAYTRLGYNTVNTMNSTITIPIIAANTAIANSNMTADSAMAIDFKLIGIGPP